MLVSEFCRQRSLSQCRRKHMAVSRDKDNTIMTFSLSSRCHKTLSFALSFFSFTSQFFSSYSPMDIFTLLFYLSPFLPLLPAFTIISQLHDLTVSKHYYRQWLGIETRTTCLFPIFVTVSMLWICTVHSPKNAIFYFKKH